MKLTGYAAIEVAERNGLTLSKYADPTEDARTGLTVDEARAIALEDPSLIYAEIDRVAAGNGDDADTGRVHEINGEQALVAWQSGVKTWTPLSDLREVR